MDTGFRKYQSIETFAHVNRWQQRKMVATTVNYAAKIKLHGTNACVRVSPNGEVTAQKRTSDISVGSDNFGFANWLETVKSSWVNTMPEVDEDIYVYGEWAGKGVNNTDAVTMLNGKYFFPFAVIFGDRVITDPEEIEFYCPDLDQVVVLPWIAHFGEVDFNDQEGISHFVERVNVLTESIGEKDPFISEIFGVDGIGEGIVVVPIKEGDIGISYDEYTEFSFKSKSSAHTQNKSAPTKVGIVVPAGMPDFVNQFVVDWRMEQGLTEACGGVADKRKMGDFLKWVGNDVRKESFAELEDMGAEWKSVAKFVNKAAVSWLLKKEREG